MLSNFWFALLIGFIIAVVFASLFEWTLHRFFMHKPTFGIRYPFVRHALIHHHVFRSDHTYHLKYREDRKTIPMAWWNGPVLIVLGTLPFMIASWITGKWGLTAGAGLAITLYYSAYERIHWCMHLPLKRKRLMERLPITGWIFFRLNGHHLLHHRYMHKNFNVVLPLADLLLGTLILRSKVTFAQAQGPSVPDVQPHVVPKHHRVRDAQ